MSSQDREQERRAGPPSKWAVVDLSQIEENVRLIAREVQGAAVMAMVKANGYGHGVKGVSAAAAAGGATWFGVSSPEEAFELRQDRKERILNVGWTHPDHMADMIASGIDMTVSDPLSLRALREALSQLKGARARVHVKIDSGMSRFGAQEGDLAEMLDLLTGEPRIDCAGVFTHFASAESDDEFTQHQYDVFERLSAPFRERFSDAVLHTSNSAGLLVHPGYRRDLVRPGIAMYGYPPVKTPLALRPAMSMFALITRVKTVPAGATVGYGRTWTAPAPTRVATLACGYADGVSRLLSNRGFVAIAGVRCPIIGTISMDQLTCDVSHVGEVSPGDRALIFGREGDFAIGADEVASLLGTIPYEILCDVAPRVPRYYIAGDGPPPP